MKNKSTRNELESDEIAVAFYLYNTDNRKIGEDFKNGPSNYQITRGTLNKSFYQFKITITSTQYYTIIHQYQLYQIN